MANNVIFRRGTSSQYNELGEKNQDTLYFLSDTHELYNGSTLYATGLPATEDKDGLMSAEDKKTLKTLAAGTAIGLKAVDKSIIVTTEAEQDTKIQVGISTKKGQALKLDPDETTGGLYVPSVKYELVQKGDAGAYAAVYQLKCTSGDGEPTFDSVEINIPKDLVVSKGEVKHVTQDNQPYSGAVKGDAYIELTISNGDSAPIYIPCKDLINGGDYVVKSVQGPNGEAIITNDPTGGGSFFKRKADNLQSYVGVHDGSDANGKPSPMFQAYVCHNEDGVLKSGTFLSGYEGMITYLPKSLADAGGHLSDAENEIATKRDLQPLVKTKINGTHGTAYIFNESDGGGAKFETSDGKISFVGVHDGSSLNGLLAQIYAGRNDVGTGHIDGCTISVFDTIVTYRNKQNMAQDINNTDLEIATKADLKGISGNIEWQTISAE